MTNYIGLAIGALSVLLGAVVALTPIGNPFLLPLGIAPLGFTTVDYFPLLPWFGVVLIGDAIGYFVYIRMQRQKKIVLQAKKLRVEEQMNVTT